jgi:hypothetical protein
VAIRLPLLECGTEAPRMQDQLSMPLVLSTVSLLGHQRCEAISTWNILFCPLV